MKLHVLRFNYNSASSSTIARLFFPAKIHPFLAPRLSNGSGVFLFACFTFLLVFLGNLEMSLAFPNFDTCDQAMLRDHVLTCQVELSFSNKKEYSDAKYFFAVSKLLLNIASVILSASLGRFNPGAINILRKIGRQLTLKSSLFFFEEKSVVSKKRRGFTLHCLPVGNTNTDPFTHILQPSQRLTGFGNTQLSGKSQTYLLYKNPSPTLTSVSVVVAPAAAAASTTPSSGRRMLI